MRRLQAVGLAYVACATFWGAPVAQAQADESLTLTQPSKPRVVPVMNEGRKRFFNYIFWDDQPRDIGALIHQPDTTSGWNAPTSTTPHSALSLPISAGAYLGSVDRTVTFRALNGGMVGSVGSKLLRYEIIGEEQWARQIDFGAPYVPGDLIDMFFINTLNGDTLDLGIELSFSTGVIDSNGTFSICIEDFEGFHVWRGIEPDASDLSVLGELSKEEEASGSPVDFLYFNDIIPSLRATGRYTFPFPVQGIPQTIDLDGIHPNGRLGPTEMIWFDNNAFNGFTYRYTVTTYDKGYDCRSGRQGLEKFDSCPVAQGVPFPCDTAITTVSTKNTPQSDLQRIYAVPNPFRTGSTRFTTPNYHNYPDNKMRFVNVPAQCKLKIYTTAGDVVWQFDHDSTNGVIEWDVRNSAGEEISSGIYIYRLEVPGGEGVFGRLVIIH